MRVQSLAFVNYSTFDVVTLLIEDIDSDGRVLDLGPAAVTGEVLVRSAHHGDKHLSVCAPRTNRVKMTALLGRDRRPLSWVADGHTTRDDGFLPALNGESRFRIAKHTDNGRVIFAIHDAAGTLSWMTTIPDTMLLSHLTLPGTHETCSREYGGNMTICQTRSLREQLDAGVRFLDIRCRHYQNSFPIHHGRVFLHLQFAPDVRDVCLDFLAAHPSECLVMSIKEEYDPEGNTQTFEQTFLSYLDGNRDRWHLADTVPALGDVRGKIVLFRRFEAKTTPLGIQALPWHDDATFDIENTAHLRVQDQYKVPTLCNIADKWEHARVLFEEARLTTNDRWFVNFTSGTSLGAYPNAIAYGSPGFEGMNDRLKGYVTRFPEGRLGSVLMDFVEYPDGLLGDLIGRNIFVDYPTLQREVDVPNTQGLTAGPSAVVFNQQLYCFHQSFDKRRELKYLVLSPDGRAWSHDTTVPGVTIAESPSALVFKDRLYCFYNRDRQLRYCVLESDGVWHDYAVATDGITAGPGAVVFNGRLYCFHQGKDDTGELRYSVTSDGLNWGPDTRIDGVDMSAGPSPVVFRNQLYCFHQGRGNDGTLRYTAWAGDGTGWSPDETVKRVGMSASPSAIVFKGQLCIFHQGYDNHGDLWYTMLSPDGTIWSSDLPIAGVGISAGPSLVVFKDELLCFHQAANDTGRLLYDIFE